MTTKKIEDQYTDVEVSRQRKHQLRNPDKFSEYQKQWAQSEAGKASIRLKNQRYRKKLKPITGGVHKPIDNG